MVHFFPSLISKQPNTPTFCVCVCLRLCVTIDIRNLATTGRLLCVLVHFVVTLVRFCTIAAAVNWNTIAIIA